MIHRYRIALALLGGLSAAGQATAQEAAGQQDANAQLATIVANWVEEEATAFHGIIRDYIGHCLTAVVEGLPEAARETILEAGDIPVARAALTGNNPEALATFQEGVRVCTRTATRFGAPVLDWVFATQLPGAEGEVLRDASFCVIDAILPLDDAARQMLFLGVDQRHADFREHGIALLATTYPAVADDLTAAVDICLTE